MSCGSASVTKDQGVGVQTASQSTQPPHLSSEQAASRAQFYAELGVPPSASGLLHIDLAAIRRNYRAFVDACPGAECAAVVKADAYGLGLEEVVPALRRDNCQTFFVANLDEAERVRNLALGARICVLSGLLPASADKFTRLNAEPVLNSLEEVWEWSHHCQGLGRRLAALIQLETGMNRLGLLPEDVPALTQDPATLSSFKLSAVMTHLGCANDPTHPLNATQLSRFETLRRFLPEAPASIANSAGIMLGDSYHLDLVRPGIALYGGRAVDDIENPMSPVLRAQARILQVKHVAAGEPIGYGSAQTLQTDRRVATLSAGYADGYFRALGGSDETPGAVTMLEGHPAPILGRVSMDLITIDVSEVPGELVQRGAFVDLIGGGVPPDRLAARAGTMDYELFTSLGRRYHRIYVHD